MLKYWSQVAVACLLVFVLESTCPAQGDSREPVKAQLYKSETGQYPVKVNDRLTLIDDNREQPLQLRVSYPGSSTGQLPVIVFSHGAGGSKSNYEPLINHWVSHGFVCVQATHGDSISLMSRSDRRDMKSLRSYINSGALSEHQLTRPVEIKLILDNLEILEKEIPQLKDRLDSEKIGMGGHSFGAHTTQMIGGLSLRNFRGRQRITEKDDRPKALLMISPQGTGGQIDEKSWEDISRPTMVVTGTRDRGRKGQSHKWRLEVYEHLPANPKYLAFVNDATHNFGGISGARHSESGPDNQQHVDYVKSCTTAFWDACLNDNETARSFLQSDSMTEATSGEARIEHENNSTEHNHHDN